MYWRTCWTSNPQSLCNVRKINSRLMPEQTLVANELQELVSNYRSLDRSWQGLRCEHLIGGLFWKMNTCHPWLYISSVHCFQAGPEGGREGKAVWWTSGTGEHPRQWYLIRLPQPSTGRRTIKEKKKKLHPRPQNRDTVLEMRAAFPVTPTPLPPPPSILI